MEDVLTILCALVFAKAGLQLSVLKDRYGAGAYVAFVCVCSFLIGGYATEVSKGEIVGVAESKGGFDNLSAVVMADFIMTLWFVRARMKKCRMRWARMCPTLLAVPAMFYVYVQVLYLGTGIGFGTIRWVMTAGIGAVMVVTKVVMERVADDMETRTEMIVYVSAMMVGLAVCGMVFHPETSIAGHSADVDLIQSIWAVAAIMGGVCVGIGYKYVKEYKKWKQ